MVRIHSPRPTFSKTYRQQPKTPGSEKGPFLDPTSSPHVGRCCRCSRVLIDLPSDDFDDLLGSDQEV